MYSIWLLILLQIDLTKPHAASPHLPQSILTQGSNVHVLPSPGKQTTPFLNQDSELMMREQMEKDIGGHSEAIGDVKRRLEELEKLRANPDRKDIDDLKSTRNHFYWSLGILSTIAVTLAGILKLFGVPIWKEMIRPRVKRVLDEVVRPTTAL